MVEDVGKTNITAVSAAEGYASPIKDLVLPCAGDSATTAI